MPKLHGGIGIQDPELANIAMGAKLWWILEANRDKWWVQVIRAKYMYIRDDWEEKTTSSYGLPIWKVLNTSSRLIKDHLERILGNGDTINIWKDKILDNSPIGEDPIISMLHFHLVQNGVEFLSQIYDWDALGNWAGWRMDNIPENLIQEKYIFLRKLKGSVSVAQ